VAVDAPNEASDGDGATMDAADRSSTPPVVVCLPFPDGGFAATGGHPGEGAASGTLVGTAVSCSLCHVGTAMYVQTAQDGGPPLAYTLYLSDSDGEEVTCMTPSDALNEDFLASIQLNGIQPGTYSSGQSNSSNACTIIGLKTLRGRRDRRRAHRDPRHAGPCRRPQASGLVRTESRGGSGDECWSRACSISFALLSLVASRLVLGWVAPPRLLD
jgi:hypothetical protein